FSWLLLFGEAKRSDRLPGRPRLGHDEAHSESATAVSALHRLPHPHHSKHVLKKSASLSQVIRFITTPTAAIHHKHDASTRSRLARDLR
ncbi:hypothetical protein, partial [Actimicrobium sp. CCI2.3]|uniref:hypothetical protein n=1 Tax=Actimicrobium sp. CCI2.3 TaxID=3048616 RepID=UPI002B249542